MTIKFEEINIGDEISRLTKDPITQLQLQKYAEASGDFNPIHLSEKSAHNVGFDGTIAHGMLMMGFVGEMISKKIEITKIIKFNVKFLKYSKPGDILTAKNIVSKKYINEEGRIVECRLLVEDQHRELKVDGKLKINFDK